MKKRERVYTIVVLSLVFALTGCAKQSAVSDAVSDPQPDAAPEAVHYEQPSDAGSKPDGPAILDENELAVSVPTVATLVVCGDVMSHMPVTTDAWDEEAGVYDYRHMLTEAKPHIIDADYAVANLETTFAGGPPYSGYPNFNSPDELADALLDTGFDLLLTANNHCMDKGFAGLCRTLDVLDEKGIPHVGTSRTAEESQNGIYVADVGGISVAFLGYTYGTNGIPLSKNAPFSVNLFNTDYLTSVSTLDTDRLLAALDQAKALHTDLIAVMIHWGIEYQTRQSSYQERVAQFLFDNGADIVLGGHPHVLQPMELRTLERDGAEKQGFVCYSLGNFIHSQTHELTETTAILCLTLTRDNETGVAEVTDYSYTPMYMLNRGKGAAEQFVLLDVLKQLSAGDGAEASAACRKSLETCYSILGEEHCAQPADEPAEQPAA